MRGVPRNQLKQFLHTCRDYCGTSISMDGFVWLHVPLHVGIWLAVRLRVLWEAAGGVGRLVA